MKTMIDIKHQEDEYVKLSSGLRGTPPNERQKYAVYVQLDGVKQEDKYETKRFAEIIEQMTDELTDYIADVYFICDYNFRMAEVMARAVALKRQIISAALPRDYLLYMKRIEDAANRLVLEEGKGAKATDSAKDGAAEDGKANRKYTRDDYEFFIGRFFKECYEGGYYLYESDSSGLWSESAWDIKHLLDQAIGVLDTRDEVRSEYERCVSLEVEIIETADALIERMKRGGAPQIFIDDANGIIAAARNFSKLMDVALKASVAEREKAKKEGK